MTLGSLRNEKLCNIFNILIQQPKFLFNKQAEVSVITDHPAPLQPLRAWGRHSAGEENPWKIKFGKVRVSIFWWGNIWQCCLHPKQAAPEMRCLCLVMVGVQPGVQAGFLALSPTSQASLLCSTVAQHPLSSQQGYPTKMPLHLFTLSPDTSRGEQMLLQQLKMTLQMWD